jgi:heterodisulfide reductase subunit B
VNRYAYFLGCITPNRYPGIELATRRVLKEFGIELFDMKGASCCPAPGVIGSFDLRTWSVVAARNISIAEEMGTDITATCNGCYATLQEANHILKQNDELKRDVNNILKEVGREYKGTVRVKHVFEILDEDLNHEKIRKMIKRPLKGIKVAVHYGCHFLKPSDVREHGTAERPALLDNFIGVLGAESVDYKDQMMCCGAGGGVRADNLDVALNYTKEKIENMVEAGADELTQKLGKKLELPVVFITQLLGLALGMTSEDVGLDKNRTQIESFTLKLPKIG